MGGFHFLPELSNCEGPPAKPGDYLLYLDDFPIRNGPGEKLYVKRKDLS